MRLLAFHPEAAQIVDYHRASGDRPQPDVSMPIRKLPERVADGDETIILGGGANTHHADIAHIRTLRKSRGLPEGRELSLVCFDWHHDIDNALGGTELTAGSWVFYGLEHDLFANAYVLGGHPTLDSEVDAATGEVLSEDWMAIRMFDRIRLFTSVGGTARLRYDARYADFLAGNPSISQYVVSADGSSVSVTYRTWREPDYGELQSKTVVSIDLDVLRDTEVRSDCPQGVLRLQDLISAIEGLRPRTRVIGWTVCGMDLDHGPLDERSLRTVSRVISTCAQ